jgi:phosphoglycolate phosphatase
MKGRGVLFDWDGTLADSVAVVMHATNRVLRAGNHESVDLAEIHSGMRFPTAVRFAFHLKLSMSDPGVAEAMDKLAASFYEAAMMTEPEHLRLFPGIREMIRGLSDAGVPMGIVTNNSGPMVRAQIGLLDLEKTFTVLIAEEDVVHPKPDPEGMEIAASTLGISSSELVYVGDSLSDAGAARAAGIRSIGAGWPRESAARSHPKEFDHIATTPTEIPSLAGLVQKRPRTD